VDDDLTGADSVEEGICFQQQLQLLFARDGFTQCKWSCSNPTTLESIPEILRESQPQCILPSDGGYTKTPRVESGTLSWTISG